MVSDREILSASEVSPMADEAEKYQDRIVQDPEIMVGKPVVKGTRIPVERILAHLEDVLRKHNFELARSPRLDD